MKSKFGTILLAYLFVANAIPAKADNDRRIVTTGPVEEIHGWQKSLCGGERNLNNWFWIPIRKQPINVRYEGGNRGAENTQSRPEYVHNTPSRSYRESLPNKVMPYVPPKPVPVASSNSSNSSGNVQGSLIDPSVSGKLFPKKAPAVVAREKHQPAEYSYGGSYSHGAAGSSSLAATSNVIGRLLHPGS
jgi:hypothetical protein